MIVVLCCILGGNAAHRDLIASSDKPVVTWEADRKQEQVNRRFGVASGPAIGIFIGGSSIAAMNGLYSQIHPASLRSLGRSFQVVYRHETSNWILGLTEPYVHDHGYVLGWRRFVLDFLGGESSEWLLIDAHGRDRFGSLGDEVVPGYGRAWGHLHRVEHDSEMQPVVGHQEDDEQELPWQVVAITSVARWTDLKHQWEQYSRHSHSTSEQHGRHGPQRMLPSGVGSTHEQEGATLDGKTNELESCEAVMEALQAVYQPRQEAEIRVKIATCLRYARDFASALNEIRHALELVSEMAQAHFEHALIFMDASRYSEAIVAFESLLRLDRSWPLLSSWLIRAHVLQFRTQQSALSPDGSSQVWTNPDHYAVLELPADSNEDDLKRVYRRLSLTFHPDKPGGCPQRFLRIAEAYETLSHPDRREAYQEGWDLQEFGAVPSFRERVERRYFPERFPFEPFGNPLAAFPEIAAIRQQRKAKQEL